MSKLTAKQQLLIGLGLALLMAATRVPYFPGAENFYGASWAVFFLAGVYLASVLAVPAFLALAVLLDAVALGWAGASSYCLTPAYAMLAPAYASLWLAGRWYASRHTFAWRTLLPLGASVFAGAALCELISSGSFYLLSDFFTDRSWAEFAARELQYFPAYLASMSLWVGIAAVIHTGVTATSGASASRAAT